MPERPLACSDELFQLFVDLQHLARAAGVVASDGEGLVSDWFTQ